MTKRRAGSDWEAWVADRLKGKSLHAPSEGALRSAIALASRLKPRETVSQWLVRLLFDSAVEPLPAGVRSSAGGQRRLLFQAMPGGSESPDDACQIDLRLRREATGTLALTGQVLPPWSGAHVELRTGRTRRKKVLGEAGEFLFRGLPAVSDRCSLQIVTDQGENLELDDVPLSFGGE